MQTKELSRGAIAGIIAGVVLVLGLAFWWRTQPQGNAKAYSDGVAKLEQSEAFKRVQAEEEWREKNPEAARMADQLNSDNAYQPETGHN